MELITFYRRILLLTGGFVICLLIIVNNAPAQKEDRVWCIGDSLGVDLNDLNKPVFFKSSTAGKVYNRAYIHNRASIADSSGKLLCYLNSAHTIIPCLDSLRCYAFGSLIDAENQVLINGDSLYSLYNTWHSASTFLKIDNELYIFIYTGLSTQESDSIDKVYGKSVQNLYYATINIQERKVIEKNIFICKNIDSGLAAIKHADGKNWWILTRKTQSDSFLVFPTEGGRILSSPVISRGKGFKDAKLGFCSRCSYFSIDSLGKNIMHTFIDYTYDIPGNLIQHFNFFHFNRSTGKLLLKKEYQNPENISMHTILSPNGEYLYVYKRGKSFGLHNLFDTLFQVTLDTMKLSFLDTTIISIRPNILQHHTTGLDGKIYFLMNSHDSSAYLSVIHQPNKPGISCDYQERAVYLGEKLDVFRLPYFPNYHLKEEPNYSSDYIPFPKKKAVWTHHANVCAGSGLPCGDFNFHICQCGNDTLIDGKYYKVLSYLNGEVGEGIRRYGYLREENKRIYLYRSASEWCSDSSQDYLVYDFNVLPDNKYIGTSFRYECPDENITKSVFTLNDTGFVDQWGKKRRFNEFRVGGRGFAGGDIKVYEGVGSEYGIMHSVSYRREDIMDTEYHTYLTDFTTDAAITDSVCKLLISSRVTRLVNDKVKIYRSADRITISVKKVSVTDINSLTLRVYNLQGQLIFSKQSDDSEWVVNTSDWKTGVYFLQIHNQDILLTQKILISE